MAAALVERVLGEGAEVLATFPGSALAGTAYEPPVRLHHRLRAARPHGARGRLRHHGRGHRPRPHGDRLRRGRLPRSASSTGSRSRTRCARTAPSTSGSPTSRAACVKDADPDIIEALRERGACSAPRLYEHSYPHCWRCDTPLLYYAKSSWYIRTTDVRDRMLAENETIGWHPEHIKHGRFGKWLEGNQDWALSRERYWGTPLPIWECTSADCEERFCAGSIADLRERGRRGPRRPPPPLHRRGHARLRGVRRRDAPRRRDDRRLVRLGLDAVRAVPLPLRGRGALRRALPGRLHQRGHRPDPRLVLLAARDLDAPLRLAPATATASASG